jgi:hypothetical protein
VAKISAKSRSALWGISIVVFLLWEMEYSLSPGTSAILLIIQSAFAFFIC